MHIYIQCIKGGRDEILMYLIENKERKCSLCKRWPCNSRREHLEIQFDYGGNSP
jgi:hypothetical protein